jgi:ribosomal protein S18 acetylase RimI-like enzyme
MYYCLPDLPFFTYSMSKQIQIRACTPGDEDALALIGQATFLETFAGVLAGQDILAHCKVAHSAEHYRACLSNPSQALWLAELSPGSAPVGFMVVAPAQLPLPDIGEDDLEIKRIYILSKFQGGGLGRKLVLQAIAAARDGKAKRLLLGVYANNESAIGFYRHMGFEQRGTRKFVVGAREYDDNIMGLSL